MAPNSRQKGTTVHGPAKRKVHQTILQFSPTKITKRRPSTLKPQRPIPSATRTPTEAEAKCPTPAAEPSERKNPPAELEDSVEIKEQPNSELYGVPELKKYGPKCRHCMSEDRFVPGAQTILTSVEDSNEKGNAGRQFYKCEREDCGGFMGWAIYWRGNKPAEQSEQ